MDSHACHPLQQTTLEQELKRFDPSLPIESAKTPPTSWYVRQDMLAFEKVQVFQPSYQVVGSLDQLPQVGSYFTGRFMGWPYVVVRDEAEKVRAFFNVCSHHLSCVAQGEGKTTQFVCPYHGWTYDLAGQLRKASHAGNIAHFHKQGLNLKPISLKCYGRFIALHFGQQKVNEAIVNGMNALAALDNPNFELVHQKTYAMACNWKVFIDNYLDGGYHVAHLHKDLAAQLQMENYVSTIFEAHVMQRCRGQSDENSRVGDVAEYLWIHPNFCANRYGNWLDTNWVIPTGPQRCEVSFAYYHLGPLATESMDALLSSSDKVQQEDMFICEQVQLGLESGVLQQGIYAPKFEKPMHLFHRILAEQLSHS